MGRLFAPFTEVAAANPYSSSDGQRLHGRGAGHGRRAQPDDRRALSATAGGARPGQPGRRAAADDGGRRARARHPRGPLGLPARPRRGRRARADAAPGPGPLSRGGAGVPGGARAGRHDGGRRCRSSTSTAATRSRCRASRSTASASPPTTRAGSPSPAACRTSAAPATTTRCTRSAAWSSACGAGRVRSGLVGANGGYLSKYSAGVYSTRPAPFAAVRQQPPAGRDRRLARAGPRRAARRLGDDRDLHRGLREGQAGLCGGGRPHRARRTLPRGHRSRRHADDRRRSSRATRSGGASTCARRAAATASRSARSG